MGYTDFENYSKLQYDELNIDWSRMLEPQDDNYDVDNITLIANKMFGYEKPNVSNDLNFLNGKVHLFQRQVHGEEIEVDLSSEGTQTTLKEVDFLIKSLTPKYYNSITQFLDGYAPFHQKDTETSRSFIGCVCGPVTRTYDTSHYLGFPAVSVTSCLFSVIGAADGIIHESWHQRLYQMGMEMEQHNQQLIGNHPDDLYNSPIRFDKKRPMSACVQAIYSYIAVSEFHKELLKYVIENKETPIGPADLGNVLSINAYNLFRIKNGYNLLSKELTSITKSGESFVHNFLLYNKRVIDELEEILSEYKEQFNLTY